MSINRYLIGGLLLSVVANLVLVGMVAGQWVGRTEFERHSAGPNRAPDPLFGMRRLLHDLPAARTDELQPHLQNYYATLRPRFREIRQAQAAVREAMLTEPLDSTRLAGALEAFNSHLYETQQNVHARFIALASELTLNERRELVENMTRPRRAPSERQRRPPPPP